MRGIRRAGGGAVLVALACAVGLVAAPAASADPAPAFAPGTYIGKTSQGLPVSFQIEGSKVISFDFKWRARCVDGKVHSNWIGGLGGQIVDGHFSWNGLVNSAGGRAHVAGKLSGTQASGRLSRWGMSTLGMRCHAAGIKWHADLAQAFKGITSQGLPIAFTATSRVVRGLHFDWSATCSDGQDHQNTIFAGGGPLTGGSFNLGGILNTGGHFKVQGTIDGSTASGTLSRRGPSAFGTNCLAAGVTWQASTSGVVT